MASSTLPSVKYVRSPFSQELVLLHGETPTGVFTDQVLAPVERQWIKFRTLERWGDQKVLSGNESLRKGLAVAADVFHFVRDALPNRVLGDFRGDAEPVECVR